MGRLLEMRPAVYLLSLTGAGLLASAGVLSCTDFGYRVPTGPDGGVDAAVDAPPDGSTACVEGVTAPSTTGPQINLITLNVDKPIVNATAGTVVTWHNTDTMVHTVTAGVPGAPRPPSQGGFDSGNIAPGAAWAWRFCSARTAIYFCSTHANQMNGYRVVIAP